MFEVNVISNTRVNDGTFLLKVDKPVDEVIAGQCFNLGVVGNGINREYSMCSDANADFLEFLIRDVENGLVSEPLGQVSPGEKIAMAGPYGEFSVEPLLEQKDKEFLFVATGTGIAPFRSFAKTYPMLNYKVVHGVRLNEEVSPSADFKKERYFSCVSRPKGEAGSRVTHWLKENSVPKNAAVFICGNRKMISEVFELCREKGVHGDDIVAEVFF